MHQEFKITSADQLELFGQYWTHGDDCRAVICLIHGMGEHSSRYEHVAAYFNSNGIAMVAIDHRGHGRSQGKKGHAPGYENLMQDIDALIHKAQQLFPGKPIWLYGHSMGGNLVLNYGIRRQPNQIKGIVATDPYLRLAFNPPGWKVALGKFSAGILPGLTQATGLETAALSRDPEVVKKYEADPLVHDKMSAAFFVNVHFAGPYAIDHAADLKLPTLVMHGTGDRLTSFKGSQEFAEKAHANVHLKLWEGFYHEIHNEPEQEQVFAYTLQWMQQHGL